MLLPKTQQDLGLIANGSYGGASDVQDHYLYDTLALQGSNQSEYKYFSTPVGGAKTIQKTNMVGQGTLPAGQNYVAQALGFKFLPNSTDADTINSLVADLYTVLSKTTLRVIITGREYDLECPASIFLPAVSIAGESATNTSVSRIGEFNVNNWIALQTPITIAQLVSFSITLLVENTDAEVSAALGRLNTAGCELRWCFRGTLKRMK